MSVSVPEVPGATPEIFEMRIVVPAAQGCAVVQFGVTLVVLVIKFACTSTCVTGNGVVRFIELMYELPFDRLLNVAVVVVDIDIVKLKRFCGAALPGSANATNAIAVTYKSSLRIPFISCSLLGIPRGRLRPGARQHCADGKVVDVCKNRAADYNIRNSLIMSKFLLAFPKRLVDDCKEIRHPNRGEA